MIGRPGESAGDQERDGDRPVDVDPHHRGRLAVCATARMALPCFVCRTNQVRIRSSGTTIMIAVSFFHVYRSRRCR